MRRLMLNLATCVSIAVFALVVAFWVRSYWKWDQLKGDFTDNQRRVTGDFTFTSNRGLLNLRIGLLYWPQSLKIHPIRFDSEKVFDDGIHVNCVQWQRRVPFSDIAIEGAGNGYEREDDFAARMIRAHVYAWVGSRRFITGSTNTLLIAYNVIAASALIFPAISLWRLRQRIALCRIGHCRSCATISAPRPIAAPNVARSHHRQKTICKQKSQAPDKIAEISRFPPENRISRHLTQNIPGNITVRSSTRHSVGRHLLDLNQSKQLCQ